MIMTISKVLTSALVAAVGLSVASGAVAAAAEKPEKCYGIVKAGKNDCGTSKHGCAGVAKADNAADEWLFMPKGLCDKIVGASTTPADAAKTDKK
jgi:uncharacterized membrane protein